MTAEAAFRNGAEQMQGKIAAWLSLKGHDDLAGKVLAFKPPDYSEPDRMIISKKGQTFQPSGCGIVPQKVPPLPSGVQGEK